MKFIGNHPVFSCRGICTPLGMHNTKEYSCLRDFILRGNVIDLAVAVVIGAAFTAIVTSFADNLINPLIASIGGANADGLGFYIRAGKEATFMDFGKIITSALNFLITAGVVYFRTRLASEASRKSTRTFVPASRSSRRYCR